VQGEGVGVAGSQPMSTAVHRSPNKLRRSNSIPYHTYLTFASRACITLHNLMHATPNYALVGVIHAYRMWVAYTASCFRNARNFKLILWAPVADASVLSYKTPLKSLLSSFVFLQISTKDIFFKFSAEQGSWCVASD
jgi:hypothetical protein